MAGLLNITGSVASDDPTYRYKMPRLVAKIEGRGNGIKTVIVNMHEIADALNRPGSLPTKFFGCELGAQSRWEDDVSGKLAGARRAAEVPAAPGHGRAATTRRAGAEMAC
jgi:translation initiation factor 5